MYYLYQFTFLSKPRDGEILEQWFQTNYETKIDGGVSYEPRYQYLPTPAITHSEVKYDNEKTAGQITITVARDHPIALKFLAGYPYGSIALKVMEGGVGEGVKVIWAGTIKSCTFNEQTAEMVGVDAREMFTKLGLRLNAGKNCQWDLYGRDCGIDQSLYSRSGVITDISEDGLTVSTTLAEADGYFKAGKLLANGQARTVTASTAGVLTLLSALSGLAIGGEIVACKGCDRTPSAVSGCKSFNNIIKFSGFADFETPKNIFTTGVTA